VPEDIDKEVGAIKAVLTALEPLRPEVRVSVIEYVVRRLQIPLEGGPHAELSTQQAPLLSTATRSEEATPARDTTPIHIRDLKEEKDPRSATEMAALVAYYLESLAPSKERKDRVTTKDITTYFKIANYPLPTKIRFTLPNTKASGYLDAVGNGAYKLNAVGHNLVVHSLPRGKATSKK
jgi:hypothetical protein